MTTMAPPAQRAWLLRLGELRFRAFCGAPVVQVSPEQWGLDTGTVRQIAAARRYRETPPDQPGFLRFEYAPGFFPRTFDRGPGTDTDRRRLAELLTGEDQFWASLRRLRLARADVGAVAAAAGMTVVAEAADPSDRLLLLRRAGLPDEELRPRTAGRLLTLAQVQGIVAVVCVLGLAAGTWLAANSGRGWPLLVIPAGLAVTIGAQLVIRAIAGRSPRLPWLDAAFDGSTQVAVPHPPRLYTELLGEVASLYGYFYGGPYVAGRNDESFLFVKCRPGLVFGSPAQLRQVGFEAPAEAPGREQWLRNHLEGRDELWVSVRHAKLPPARIAEIAGGEGLVPAGEFTDATDRIVLLRRALAAPPQAGRRFRMSFVGFLAPAAWLVLCVGGSVLTTVLTGDARTMGLGVCLAVLGLLPAAWVLRIFPRSTRVGWLAKEFNGQAGVTFFSGQFGVSPELTGRIAASRGYSFGTQTGTGAQGALVTYVRT